MTGRNAQILALAAVLSVVLGFGLVAPYFLLRRALTQPLHDQRARVLALADSPTFLTRSIKSADNYLGQPASETTFATPSSELRENGVHTLMLIHGPEATIEAVAMEFGGADNHFGLLITMSEKSPLAARSIWPVRHLVAPRVGLYDELDVIKHDNSPAPLGP